MSNQKIEDSAGLDGIIAAAEACKGAPASIQPGAVVKMAKALEVLIVLAEVNDPAQPAIRRARAALAMYYGENQ